jgi:hypothetical protein
MGNWGNVSEMEVPVGTSVTTKLKPSSDGSRYWFIAWEDKHPLLELYSEWEVCTIIVRFCRNGPCRVTHCASSSIDLE